ncbi:MAG TPA: phosphopantothenoylcysteine decarboxylase [Candidatus Omnitrophota bacterium]|nr:phosphopantothenoylcysteine decarboxylase [Candidatus Omnitrophota bacterium]
MRVLIAAGPTREMIDPIRYISNLSTGRMGFELAKESIRRGYPTTLISGPTNFKAPPGVKWISIISSSDLERMLRKYFDRCDVLFMPSAVCDFRPLHYSHRKVRRRSPLKLTMVATPDLLKKLARKKAGRTVVGFCLETENLIENAGRKLREKKLDYIVANRHGKGNRAFGDLPTTVFILGKDGSSLRLARMTKKEIAKRLLDRVISPEK